MNVYLTSPFIINRQEYMLTIIGCFNWSWPSRNLDFTSNWVLASLQTCHKYHKYTEIFISFIVNIAFSLGINLACKCEIFSCQISLCRINLYVSHWLAHSKGSWILTNQETTPQMGSKTWKFDLYLSAKFFMYIYSEETINQYML